MGSIPGQFPISLRPWPLKDDKTVQLSSLISRIDSERGSFREISEEGLIEEVQKDEAEIGACRDNNGIEVEDVEEEPDRVKELTRAQGEILGQLEQAHNTAMITLDFVSLLLSKDTPVQASLSISPALRDAVALGTLGLDKVQESGVGKSQKQDNRRIAKGWKLQSLIDTVDSILASATRLEKEIEKETKYWEQVLTVSENGWAICRLPHERHTLGVRFGFAESAPQFSNRSLGALRRNIDGNIHLDQGTVDSTQKRVRVRIQTNGITTGQMAPSESIPSPASIESSILVARNTIFEEELWQELNREVRTLTNQGVRALGDKIVCAIGGNKQIVLDLQAIEDDELYHRTGGLSDDDTIAELISLSLHHLLSFAHRQNHRRRSRPPPPINSRPPLNPPYSLLRPILARLHHEAVISDLTNLLAPLSRALISTGVSGSAYTIITALVTSTIQAKTQLAKHLQSVPERTISALMSNLSAELTIPIIQSPYPPQVLTIRLHTALSLETRFDINLTGSLAKSCQPPPNLSSLDEVKSYILWATACALTRTFSDQDKPVNNDGVDIDEVVQGNLGSAESNLDHEKQSSGIRDWRLTQNPTLLRKSFANEKDCKELSFKVDSIQGEQRRVEIQVMYKYVNSGTEEELQHLGSHPAGIIEHVWKSECAKNDTTTQQNEEVKGNIPLSQFVEEVGRWDKSSGCDEHIFGDAYEVTGVTGFQS